MEVAVDAHLHLEHFLAALQLVLRLQVRLAQLVQLAPESPDFFFTRERRRECPVENAVLRMCLTANSKTLRKEGSLSSVLFPQSLPEFLGNKQYRELERGEKRGRSALF